MDPSDIPDGSSPLLQDVEFDVGNSHTRRGMLAVVNGAPSLNGNINYLKSFKQQNQDLRTLILDSSGDLYYRDMTTPGGPLALIGNVEAGCSCESASAFGRTYLALGDGLHGRDIPRQYDGTYFDRVSQDGPGLAPIAQDYALSESIIASAGGLIPTVDNIATISQVGNLVTVTIAGFSFLASRVGDTVTIAGNAEGYDGTFPIASIINGGSGITLINNTTGLAPGTDGTINNGLVSVEVATALVTPVGSLVTIASASDSSYDGTFTVRLLGNPATTIIVYNPTNSGSASGGGTITQVGQISAGVHQLTVMFLTRQGYITRPPFPTKWTAAGNLRALISNIPTGPSNVVARILSFTPAASDYFFYVPTNTVSTDNLQTLLATSMIIPDNVSTTAVVDFNDITLQAAISIDTAGNNLWNLVVLKECLGVFSYASRLAWWGELASLENTVNMGFDGGFDPTNTFPLGWNLDPTNGAGGSRETANVVWGFAYKITGTGGLNGMITQNVFQDAFGVPVLNGNTAYSVRVRLAWQGSLLAGSVYVDFDSPTAGYYGAFTVPVSSIGTSYAQFSGQAINASPSFAPDTVMRIYTNGVTGNVWFDEVEVFPTAQPYNNTQLRLSYVQNPESFDGVTGLIGLAEADAGENVMRCFELREDMDILSDGALYSTSDNGTTEPSGWNVAKVANTTGTCSVHGSASGEQWEVIANQNGLYMFTGSEPLKSNQEIYTSVSGLTISWDQINWKYGNTIWVVNDVARRQIFVGVPIGANVVPNQILMVDYKELQTSYQIAEEGPIHTSYSGKVISWEPGRKWSPWNFQSASGEMIEQSDGTFQLWIGNGANNAKIYSPTEGQYSDDGTAIDSLYTTAPLPNPLLAEQNPLLGLNRMFFSFLTMYVQGNGTLTIKTFPVNLTNPGPVYTVTLSANPTGDTEVPLHVAGERCFFQISTNEVGSWWKISKFSLRLRRHAMAAYRHVN